MKAKLILKHRGDHDYFLVSRTDNSEALVASLNPDEEIFEQKLSTKNCDEIFGVVDLDKLANEAFPDESEPGWRDSFSPRERKGFKSGFNKAMELNKYTEEDIDKAYWAGMKFVGEDKGSYEEFIQSLQQPTEIEVEIEMVKTPDAMFQFHDVPYSTPKLDSEGCLILKKI